MQRATVLSVFLLLTHCFLLSAADEPHRDLTRRLAEITALSSRLEGGPEAERKVINEQINKLRKSLNRDVETLVGGQLLTKEHFNRLTEEMLDQSDLTPFDAEAYERVLIKQSDLAEAAKDYGLIHEALWRLASLYRSNLKSPEKGEAVRARHLRLAETLKGPTSDEVLDQLQDALDARYFFEKGDPNASAALIDRMAQLLETRGKPTDERDVNYLISVCHDYRRIAETAKAERITDKLIGIAGSLPRPRQSVVLGRAIGEPLAEAVTARKEDRVGVLEPLLHGTIADAAAIPDGRDRAALGGAYCRVAAALIQSGAPGRAEPYRRAILPLWDSLEFLQTSGVDIYTVYRAYVDQKDFVRAEPFVRRILSPSDGTHVPELFDPQAQSNFALKLYDELGLTAGTEPYLQMQIQHFERKGFATYSNDLAPELLGEARLRLAAVYQQLGKLGLAEKELQRAFDLAIARPNGPNSLASACGLADIAIKTGRVDSARERVRNIDAYLVRVIPKIVASNTDGGLVEVRDKVIGDRILFFPAPRDHAISGSVSAAQLEIQLARRDGKLVEVDAAIRKATDRIKSLDPKRSLPDDLTLELISLRIDQGRFEEARTLLDRTLDDVRRKNGGQHPFTVSLEGLSARLFDLTGKTPWALKGWDVARRGQREYLNRVLTMLSESDQLRLLKENDEPSLHAALSFARSHATDGSVTETSAAWVVNGKGVAAEVIARRNLAPRDVRDQKQLELEKDLRNVRDQLARRSIAGTKSVDGPSYEALSRKEQELARNVVGEEDLRGTSWVELADVRRAIPAQSVLVEVIRTRMANRGIRLSEAWAGERYLAWVIPPAGSVKIVDLGSASEIDDLVVAARKVLELRPDDLRKARESQEMFQAARSKIRALSARVLDPLENALGDADQWILSPDGALWQFPWEALLSGEKFVVEKHRVRYVVTGRDLVAAQHGAPTGRPLLLADPDYGQPRVPPAGQPKASPSRDIVGLMQSIPFGRIARLKATATEAQQVAPQLTKYAGKAVDAFLGKGAVERIVKDAHSPSVLHLATHGFFIAPERNELGIPANPLTRCGVLLAGANDAPNVPADADDGVLTGMEIVGVDLRGTRLVVLSACQTGLGEVRSGEGVAGLRQAFHLAGAETVVASLWSVPDSETATLMYAFYQHLGAGERRAEALRNAQLFVIKELEDGYGIPHPYFWAAFTSTGRD